MKKFMMGLVAMLMIVVAGVLVPINGDSVYERLTASSSNDAFSFGDIKEIGEMNVLSVNYSEIQTIDNSDSGLSKIPFGKSKVLIKVPGTIKIGFDFADLKISKSGDDFKVSVPEMKVTSNERQKFVVLSDQESLFAKISHEKLLNPINKKFDKNEYAKKVLKNNHAAAQKSAETLIKSHIEGFDPKANITFTTDK